MTSDTFWSTATSEGFKVNPKLNCDGNCLIYVGESTDEFCLRWNNYRSNDRKSAQNEACVQENLFEHFKSEGHSGFLGNVSTALTDKTGMVRNLRREKITG